MTDVPIIFSGPMVRALLDGRKTMTRRLAWRTANLRDTHGIDPEGAFTPASWQRVKPGDRLWVRENFWLGDFGGEPEYGPNVRPLYAADFGADIREHTKKITPSIHMPRRFSRLTLLVTATKIERVQSISETDARAEGWKRRNDISLSEEVHRDAARDWFADLWGSLHGVDSWRQNPEAVALTFAVHRENIDKVARAAA